MVVESSSSLEGILSFLTLPYSPSSKKAAHFSRRCRVADFLTVI